MSSLAQKGRMNSMHRMLCMLRFVEATIHLDREIKEIDKQIETIVGAIYFMHE